MLTLNTAQEASLLAVFEGKPTETDVVAANLLFRTLVGRRTFRLGIEQAGEQRAASAAMRQDAGLTDTL